MTLTAKATTTPPVIASPLQQQLNMVSLTFRSVEAASHAMKPPAKHDHDTQVKLVKSVILLPKSVGVLSHAKFLYT